MEKQGKKQKQQLQQHDFLKFVVFTNDTHYRYITNPKPKKSKKKAISKMIRKALSHGEHFFGTEENNKKLQPFKNLAEQEKLKIELKKKIKMEKIKEEYELSHQYPKNEKKDDDKRQPSFCLVKGCTLTLVDGKYCCQPCNFVCDDYVKGRFPTCSCENIRPVVYELKDERQNKKFLCTSHWKTKYTPSFDLKELKAECKECGWLCCMYCFKIYKTKAQKNFLANLAAQKIAFYDGCFTYNKDADLPKEGKYVEGQGCGATISAGQQFWRYAYCHDYIRGFNDSYPKYIGNFLMESKALSDIKCGPKQINYRCKLLAYQGEVRYQGDEQFICMKCVGAQGMKQFKSIYQERDDMFEDF